jgi:1,4-alpha-glucan branching enzyme
MPINPISTTKSKGPLGSYYAISDYKKVNPEFGTSDDFRSLVEKAHSMGIYIIIDWVPGHTGWDHNWINENPDYYLKNEEGKIIDPINPFTGESFGWTDVADLNYDNLEMQQAMMGAMAFWVKEFDIDGFRVDQAYAVPQSFYERTFKMLKSIKPIFLLAETDINHPGGIELVDRFDASYDWVGHHLSKEIAQGKKDVNSLRKHFSWINKNYKDENVLINFLTNHDENSWNGSIKEIYGDAEKVFTALSYLSPGMPLIYSGQEYDLDKRLLFFEKDSFPKVSGATIDFLKKMGDLKNNHPALKASLGYEKLSYIETNAEDKILAFERRNKGDTIVFIANFSSNHSQFRMNYDSNFKSFPKGTEKTLSSTYEYVMKPWEFWILIK